MNLLEKLMICVKTIFSKIYRHHIIPRKNCIQCYEAKLKTVNKGETLDTSKLEKGELLHIDFKFFEKTSIRGFTTILTIFDAKTRKLWVFPRLDKSPQIEKLKMFFKKLELLQYKVMRIRVDEGGELSRSTYFCSMILKHKSEWKLQEVFLHG